MPPTMIVTVGALASTVAAPAPAAVVEPDALLAQAAIVVAARKAAPAAPMRLVFMELSFESVACWCVLVRAEVLRCWGAGGMRGLLDGRTSMGLRGAPPQQAPLEDGDECLRRQGDNGDEDHAGQHPVHVEVVLRRADQQAQALVGAEDLADEGADEGEAEADVQARQ